MRAPPALWRMGERARARGRPAWLRRVPPDLLAVVGLAVALGGLVLFAAWPRQFTYAVDRLPRHFALRNFYGVERNASGPFRWSKPEAALDIPAIPGASRVTLRMQDSPAAQPPRWVTIYLNGVAADTVLLEATARPYTFQVRLDPRAWTGALQVELQTVPFTPPGDDRALGVLLSGVTVAPAEALDPWQPRLLIPNLLLLLVAYGALRLAGRSVAGAAGGLGGALAAYALLGLGAPIDALLLAYQASAHPWGLVNVMLWLVATALLARASSLRTSGTGEPGALTDRRRIVALEALGETLWLFSALQFLFWLFTLVAWP